ncbi:MAG: transposase [Dehalococcoidia bacterium]
MDYRQRDQALFVGFVRELIPEDHLLLRLEAAIDLAPLVTPLAEHYSPDTGRPAVHPEILIRALLISRLYNIPSFRELCRQLRYNLAYRYFCHLPLNQPVFDHSTITHFLERVGREAFDHLCEALTELLRQRALLGDDGYLDSSLLDANASADGLAPTELSTEDFAAAVVERNGLFLGPAGPEPDAPLQRYQDRRGKLPLPVSDPDARWGKGSKGPARLSYKLSALTEGHGFILKHRLDLATVADHEAGAALLSGLPPPRTLAADKGYSAGAFRAALRQRDIVAYIPLPAGHPPAFLEEQGFTYGPFTITCREGRQLRARHRPQLGKVRYRALARECAECQRRRSCRAAAKHGFELGADTRELVLAQTVNATAAYRRAQRRRRTVSEGVFGHLKAVLGLHGVKLRGLERVSIETALAVLAHNLKKLALRCRPRPAVALAGKTSQACRRHLYRPNAHRRLHTCRHGRFSTGPEGWRQEVVTPSGPMKQRATCFV